MEEDILQRVIQEIKTYGDLDGIEDIRPLGKALENLIARNKELEERDKANRKVIREYSDAIPKSKVTILIKRLEYFKNDKDVSEERKEDMEAEIADLKMLLQEGDK